MLDETGFQVDPNQEMGEVGKRESLKDPASFEGSQVGGQDNGGVEGG